MNQTLHGGQYNCFEVCVFFYIQWKEENLFAFPNSDKNVDTKNYLKNTHVKDLKKWYALGTVY